MANCIYCGCVDTLFCCRWQHDLRGIPHDWIIVPAYVAGVVEWRVDSWDDNRTCDLHGYKTKVEAIAAAKEAVK